MPREFNFPCARGTSAIPTSCRFSVAADRLGNSARTSDRLRKVCKSVSMRRGLLPVAACRKSNSSSLKCLLALGRFLGRTCRCGRLSDLRQAISLPSTKYLGPSRSEIAQAFVDQRSHVPWANHAPNNVGRQSAVPHTRCTFRAARYSIVGRMWLSAINLQGDGWSF
jgi:hypothetical protein